MSENQHNSVEVQPRSSSSFMMPQKANLEEACKGLLMAIRYVDDHPTIDPGITHALRKILLHIDKFGNELSMPSEKPLPVTKKLIHISDHIGYVKSFPCVSGVVRINNDIQSKIPANDLVIDAKGQLDTFGPLVACVPVEQSSKLFTHPNDAQMAERRISITKLDQIIPNTGFNSSFVRDCGTDSTNNGVTDNLYVKENSKLIDDANRDDTALLDDVLPDTFDDIEAVTSPEELSVICANFPQPSLDKPRMCQKCGQCFKVNRLLRKHINIDCCRCDNCGEIFISQDSLQKHSVANHEVTCSCSSCGQLFSSSTHLQLHHSRYPRCLKCEECAMPLSSERILHAHFIKFHKVSCECSCGMKFKHKYSLQLHKKSHPSCCECQTCGIHTVSAFERHVCTRRMSFQCIVCQMNFLLFSDLRGHVQSHLNLSKMLICSDKFHVTLYYLLKQSIPNQQLPTHCTLCKKNFTVKPQLINLLVNGVKFPMCIRTYIKILKNQLERPPFKCTLCPKIYGKMESFKKHVNDIHKGMIHKCDTCDKLFSNIKQFNTHVKYHDESQIESCRICGKTVLRTAMSTHIHTHDGKAFHCDHCSLYFRWEASFKIHLEKHNERNVLKCPYCTHKFQFQSRVMSHVKTMHSDKLHTCETCNKSFVSYIGLCAHIRGKHPEKRDELNSYNSQRNVCSTCGKVYKWPSGLRTHMKQHSNDMLHACDICGKRFRDKASCKYHAATHGSTKPYKCSSCGQYFKTKNQRAHHKVLHMGNMAIKCSICDKVCVTKYMLKIHMLSRHTDGRDKPYHCETCQKGFILRCHLKYHQQQMHNKSKNYKCSKCDRMFVYKKVLLHHETNVHQLKEIHPTMRHRCVPCNVYFESISKLVAHRKLSRCLICGLELGTHTSLCGHMKAHQEDTDNTNK